MNIIGRRPSPTVKQQIIVSCLGTSDVANLLNYSEYLNYYEGEVLKTSQFGKRFSGIPRTSFAITHHEQLLRTIRLLVAHADKTKAALRDDLRQSFENADEKMLDNVLDLAARIWLMINIRNPSEQLQAPQTPVISWASGQSLQDVVTSLFSTSRYKIDAKDSRILPSFTACFMVDVCGLRLEWTNCLADHLRLDRRAKALRVFPYKGVLQAHLEWSRSAEDGTVTNPLPESLLRETIWSLNLLFPHYDHATNSLLKSMDQRFQQQGPFDLPSTPDLIEFDHWRDRLSELYDVVFMSPPASWAQLWRDRRNPQQFWTFWIALVILALTLISTVASVVQAWASIRALRAQVREDI